MSERRKLIFLDTNILLDFYRCRTDAALDLLEPVGKIQKDVILTFQVEMEFKARRQKAILETFKELKAPSQISRPGLFSDERAFLKLQADLKEAEQQVAVLRDRLKNLLKTHNGDPVYTFAQSLFSKEDEITLRQNDKAWHSVRRDAVQRFLLGFPPRKPGDTSIGDSVNWEWILTCANRIDADVIVVSRDSDYGTTIEEDSFLNDWLADEFRFRVHHSGKVQLFTRLSEALRQGFNVGVSKRVKDAEEQLISSIPELTPAERENRTQELKRVLGEMLLKH